MRKKIKLQMFWKKWKSKKIQNLMNLFILWNKFEADKIYMPNSMMTKTYEILKE